MLIPAKTILLAAVLPLFAVGFARAQEAQTAAGPAARCSGVLCDLYYAGRPAGQPVEGALACHDFVCGMFGGRTPDQPPTQQIATTPEPTAMPAESAHKLKGHHKNKQHMAKAAPKAAHEPAPDATAEPAAR